MKPFNLERALAGDPVVSRGGEKIESLRHGAVDEITLLVGNFEGDFFDFFWTEEGRFVFTEGEEVDHQNDLFMGSVKREGWMVLYEPNCCGERKTSDVYPSREALLHSYSPDMPGEKIVKVRWEE